MPSTLFFSTIGSLRCTEDAPATTPEEATEEGSCSMLIDGEDGWFDITEFVDQSYGFVPLVIPIT